MPQKMHDDEGSEGMLVEYGIQEYSDVNSIHKQQAKGRHSRQHPAAA
jgi:hypothetical protein